MGVVNLDLPISKLNGIGPRRAAILERRGIKLLRDLLYNFPRSYKNLLQTQNINELVAGQEAVIKAELVSIASQRLFRRRMTVTNAVARDKTGIIRLVWFNQPFISNVLKEGENHILYGKVVRNRKTGALQMASPKYERTLSLMPIYSETEGMSSKQIRTIMSAIVDEVSRIEDNLSSSVKDKYRLMPLGEALRQIHCPNDNEKLGEARRRLAFDELLAVVTKFMEFDRDLAGRCAPQIKINKTILKKFVSKLPYKLTDEQRLAAWRIIKKMADKQPLNALLNGDVGSGKTVVALLASLGVVDAGYNAVWLAPTQILARQHFETISQLISDSHIDISLVTADTKHSNNHSIQAGVIIGTHALLHRKEQLKNIGLVVVDEQHRFGVEQRRALLSADARTNFVPHFLSMTATPIPRSLAMMLSGMTDLITIKSKPVGRKKIVTKIVDEKGRKIMYQSIEKELVRGRQVYVIAPLIEESDRPKTTLFGDEKRAAAREADNLKKVFPKRKIGLLHGKMKSAEKEKIMQQMLHRDIDILVSTTVVEVGVDIPNATAMVIENANYFGLAQLHQLRGRVGRSQYQSYCYLSTGDELSRTAKHRLEIMEKTNDGFVIAQKDLELRGPGTIVGTQQAGFFDLRLASLGDTMLIEQAREAAQEIYHSHNHHVTQSEDIRRYSTHR